MKCFLVEESVVLLPPAPEKKLPENVHILYPNPEEEYLDGVMHAQAMLDSLEPMPRKKILTPKRVLIFYAAGYLQTDIAPESGHRILREIDIPQDFAEIVHLMNAVQQECAHFYAKNPSQFFRDTAGEYVPNVPEELKQHFAVIDRACTLLDEAFRPMFIELGLISKSPAG